MLSCHSYTESRLSTFSTFLTFFFSFSFLFGAYFLQNAAKDKAVLKDWYDMPVTEMTPGIKRDLQLIQMRGALDPKRFYRKTWKELPKHFQVIIFYPQIDMAIFNGRWAH
jgi:hypothetical protein